MIFTSPSSSPRICARLLARNWCLATTTSWPASRRRFFAGSGERNLGMAVDRPWHSVVRNRDGVLAEDVLGHQDGLGVADVRELRRVDDVADCVHTRLARTAVLVDFDEPAIGDLHPGTGQAELVGEWPPTDADDDHIDLEVLDLAAISGDAVNGRATASLSACGPSPSRRCGCRCSSS